MTKMLFFKQNLWLVIFRNYSGNKKAEDCRSKSLVELENQRNSDQQGHTYSPSPPRKADSSLSANKGSDTSGKCSIVYK